MESRREFPVKAFGYYRVARDPDDAASVRAQREGCAATAVEYGWPTVDVFTDPGDTQQ